MFAYTSRDLIVFLFFFLSFVIWQARQLTYLVSANWNQSVSQSVIHKMLRCALSAIFMMVATAIDVRVLTDKNETRHMRDEKNMEK